MESFTTANSIDTLKEGDSITFHDTIVYGHHGFGHTVQRITEKAVQIGGHWLPKSQLHARGLVTITAHDVQCNEFPVELLAIEINEWFDKKLYRSLPKVYPC